MTTIHATIVLERGSQKGIVIGKGGKKLKSIGIAARKDIEKMLGQKGSSEALGESQKKLV